MWFLFFQIWIWLLVAFVLGWAAHWFFCCRGKESSHEVHVHESASTSTLQASSQPTASNFKLDAAEVDTANITDDWKPVLFSQAPDRVDDLKQIKGVGQVLEKTLHDLGVYQFQQIADWTDEHVIWMNNFLSFTGRIDREDWRNQAKTLAAGGNTEFASRVAKGDVEY